MKKHQKSLDTFTPIMLINKESESTNFTQNIFYVHYESTIFCVKSPEKLWIILGVVYFCHIHLSALYNTKNIQI